MHIIAVKTHEPIIGGGVGDDPAIVCGMGISGN